MSLDWKHIAQTFHVVSAGDLIALNRLARHQEVRDVVRWLGPAEPPLALLFISHRWETLEHPDPTGRQYAALQAFLRRIGAVTEAMLAARPARLRIVSTLEREGDLQAEELARRMLGFGHFADDTVYRGAEAARKRVEREYARHREDSAAFRSWLISQIGVWIDYVCMPQRPLDAADDATFRRTLRELDGLVASATIVALRQAADDYVARGWCAAEFFLGSAHSFARGLFVNIDGFLEGRPVALPKPPTPTTPDAGVAATMSAAYEQDLAAWRQALDEWSAADGPIAAGHPSDAWARYRDLQGSAFTGVAADPNPFRRALDAIAEIETALVAGWLMSDRARTFDLGNAARRVMEHAGLRCANEEDLVYLAFVLASNGWVDAFRPLYRSCLRRYVDGVRLSIPDAPAEWPALVVTLRPLDTETRALFGAVRPSSPGTWYSRLRSHGRGSAQHEGAIVERVRAQLAHAPPNFEFLDGSNSENGPPVEDLR
jgi:hypothetical protein